ncbi:MAG: FtsW/RodA/SpoVE family cell cycle protein, partial [Gemmiger sp.]
MDVNSRQRPSQSHLNRGAHPLSRGLLFRKEERGPVSWYFVATLLLVLAYGLIVMFSASYPTGYYRKGDLFYYILPQLKVAVFGVIVMFGISFINYRWLRNWVWALYAVVIVLLVAALLTPMKEGFEFHRWIYVGGASFQPSELAKFCTMLTTAYLIDRYRNNKGLTAALLSFLKPLRKEPGLLNALGRVFDPLLYGVVIPALPMIPMLVLIWKEPHKSCTILLCAIFFTMLLCAGRGLGWAVGAGFAAGAGFLMLLVRNPDYAQERLAGWSLWAKFTGQEVEITSQTKQSLYAIASGGMFGVGIGNSRQKHLWLPEASNDFVFAILCEELGFVGAALCMILFAVLIVQGIVISLNAPDLFGTMLGIGITSQIAWQVAFNIAVVTNTIPNTGISLPFFSSGGTSLMILLAEMGVMLSISRAGNAKIQAQRKAKQEALA